ncbi:beta family protein [Tateyamaria sp.]|uniref:beta family protein n=1 Tax=Tateyamaria sp. TaxID=1929288 RepID=UPI00329C3A64
MLENINYVPTLALRSSELKGLGFLPDITKRRMRPCFLLAPWSRTPSLARAVERLEQSYGVGSYFLDIDRDYVPTNDTSPAQIEWLSLLDPANSYQNWCTFACEHSNVIPALQLEGQTDREILTQVQRFQQAGKQFFVRESRLRPTGGLLAAISALNSVGTADFAVILEGGWSSDVLQLPVWYTGIIQGQLQELNSTVPVVASCTSMPKSFSQFNNGSQVNFNNRQLVAQVQSATNRGSVIYGDWGSTRPREQSGGGGHFIPPRIDYPTDNSWWIYRNADVPWTFQQAARALVEGGDVWDGDTDQWGEQMIAQTVVNEASGIDTLQKNVTVRVNLHLHRQAFYGAQRPSLIEFEDDWTD